MIAIDIALCCLVLMMTSMFRQVMSSSLFFIASLIVILGEGNLLFSTTEINTRVAAGGNGSAWDSFSLRRLNPCWGERNVV